MINKHIPNFCRNKEQLCNSTSHPGLTMTFLLQHPGWLNCARWLMKNIGKAQPKVQSSFTAGKNKLRKQMQFYSIKTSFGFQMSFVQSHHYTIL